MTKIKLLNNRSRILKELLHRININNDICLEIDLSKEETLYLKLNINSYEKINIINNLLDKNIISNAIYVDNKKVIKNTYTLNKANINRKVLAYQDQVSWAASGRRPPERNRRGCGDRGGSWSNELELE